MWRFYWTLTREIPQALWTAADLWVSIIAAVLFFVALFNQKLEEKFMISWHALSPWWSVLPVGMFLLYGLMRSNYEHYKQMESGFNRTIEALNAEVANLKKSPRNAAQERDYQEIKSVFDKYGEAEKAILWNLRRHGKMIFHHSAGLAPLPPGFNTDRAAPVLRKMAGDHILTEEYHPIPGGWQNIWQISPGALPILEELLS